MHSVTVPTQQRAQLVDVTSEVQNAVRQAGVQAGHCICYIPHTTAGITIQENADPDVVRDLLWKLDQLVPHDDPGFHHSEGNADAHIKASMMGSSVTVLVDGGRLVLGTWQGIYFCEFDGPRQRQMLVRVVAG